MKIRFGEEGKWSWKLHPSLILDLEAKKFHLLFLKVESW